MGRFILRRLLASIPALFLVSLITFGLLWLVPGDPASAFLDTSVETKIVEREPVERPALGVAPDL